MKGIFLRIKIKIKKTVKMYECVKPVNEKNPASDLTLTWTDDYKERCKYTIPTTHV